MNRQGNHSTLGNKLATFRNRPIRLITWLLVIFPAGLFILFCFIYGILLAGNAFQQHGPALALLRGRGWFILGAVLLLVLVTYFLFRIMQSFQRLEVFSKGIRYRNYLLQTRIYQWSDLSGITSSATKTTFFGRDLRTIPGGKIFPKSGKPIDLSSRIQGVPRLIKIVKSKIYPLLWPEMKREFLHGASIQFGRISVNKDYLLLAKEKIPWSSVDSIWVDSGSLVVNVREESNGRVPISHITNLELLLRIVDWGFQS